MVSPTFVAPLAVPLRAATAAGWDKGKPRSGAAGVILIGLCVSVLVFAVLQTVRSRRPIVAAPALLFVLIATGLFFFVGAMMIAEDWV